MRIKIAALFTCLAMAFVAPACAVQPQTDDGTESTESELKTDEATTSFTCNGREPGRPIPFGKEFQFEACQTNCLAPVPHPSAAACKSTCCLQFTGCNQCYEQ